MKYRQKPERHGEEDLRQVQEGLGPNELDEHARDVLRKQAEEKVGAARENEHGNADNQEEEVQDPEDHLAD